MKNASTFTPGNFYGNDLTIEVVKRTAKTVTIKTQAWGEQRVKVRAYGDNNEAIFFKAWMILATDEFNKEEAAQNAYERAYA